MIDWPDPKLVQRVPFKNQIIQVKVINVHDGDTCTVLVPIGNEFLKLALRFYGIDAPEVQIHARQNASEQELYRDILEKRAGNHVKSIVETLVNGKVVEAKFLKWDKYGGRIVADLFIPREPDTQPLETISSFLLSKGYVKPFDGNSKKSPWIEDELLAILEH